MTSPGGSYCHHGTGLGVIPDPFRFRRIGQLGCQVHATAKWMLGFIGYYGLAAAPPITAMVVSIAQGEVKQAWNACPSSLIFDCSRLKRLVFFSNLKMMCIAKCLLLRCTPTQVYEDGRWKWWKHGILMDFRSLEH